MKDIILSEEEAQALYRLLRSSWVPPDDQKVIYELTQKLAKELGIE